MMKVFCERQGKDIATVKFTYDGEIIRGHQTAESVGLKCQCEGIYGYEW